MIPFEFNNPTLDGNTSTSVGVPSKPQDTNLFVYDTSAISVNDYFLVESPGNTQAELAQIKTIISSTELELVNPLLLAHPAGAAVTKSFFNEVLLYRSTSGAYSLLATIPIQYNQEFTTYQDVTGLNTYNYYYMFSNSTNLVTTAPSTILSGSGYTSRMFYSIKRRARRLLKDNYEVFIEDDEMGEYVNEEYGVMQNIATLLNKDYGVVQEPTPLPTTTEIHEYALPADFYDSSLVLVSRDGVKFYPASFLTKDQLLRLENRIVPMNSYAMGGMFGEPEIMFCFNGSNLRFYPTFNGFWEMYYYPVSIEMVNDTDIPLSPINNFCHVMVDYAVMRGYQKSGRADLQRVELLEKTVEGHHLKLKTSMQLRQFQQNPRMQSNDSRWQEPFLRDTFGGRM